MTGILCPDCQREISADANGSAFCSSCDKEFKCLYLKQDTFGQPPQGPNPQARHEIATTPNGQCPKHPDVAADTLCRVCGGKVCEKCIIEMPDGRKCVTCVHSKKKGPPALNPAAQHPCVNHAGKKANHFCSGCQTAICDTCAFQTGLLNVCPKCATSKSEGISSGRNMMIYGSMGLALLSTILLVVLLLSQSEEAGAVVGVGLLISVLTGSCVSTGALEAHQPNPLLLWVALGWNLLCHGIFGLLVIIGTLFM